MERVVRVVTVAAVALAVGCGGTTSGPAPTSLQDDAPTTLEARSTVPETLAEIVTVTTALPPPPPPPTTVPATEVPLVTGAPVTEPPAVSAPASPAATSSVVLRPGDSGEQVRRLQAELRDRGYRVDIDGVYGPGTEAAVRSAQVDLLLEVDGLAGPQTQASLGVGSAASSPHRSNDEFSAALVARLNGQMSAIVPADAITAIVDIDIDGVQWTVNGSGAGLGDRVLTDIVLGGDGGVYIFATVCTRRAPDGTFSWCGLWSVHSH